MRTIALIFLSIIIVVSLIISGLIIRSCSTTNQIANKTVFNAQQHVVSYDQFRNDYEAYQRYVNSYCNYLKIYNNKKLTTDEKVTLDGYYKMAMDVAQRYNSNAMKFYKKIWIGSLPKRLPLKINCNTH